MAKNASCTFCGMRGHYETTCHVQARDSREPDVADVAAQQLVPTRLDVREARVLVARLIRERGPAR